MIPIYEYGKTPEARLFARMDGVVDVSAAVAEILARVEKEGDKALLDYSRQFDHAELTSLEVTRAEIEAAKAQVEPEFLRTLEEAAEHIREFHEKQKRTGFVLTRTPGMVMGQRVIPMDRVGVYVPGGTAAYPSTVLMDTIPAKIAGCPEILMVSPPTRGGTIAPAILAAAAIAGVDRVFKVGGAQAVAALAYGTESIPKADKIVGPGNAYVAEAKRQVYGRVAIDMIAGPSEVLVVADGKSEAKYVAADLLAQAEHDKLATAILITDSPTLARAVAREVERQLALLPRQEIARASIDGCGRIILVKDIPEAMELANRFAPEHLELCLDEPFAWLDRVKHAGSVFLGRSCPEALGDYFAGPNHTLPTMGTARFSSPLSVDDFVKKTQFLYYTEEALRGAGESVARFARKEGLEAHARSVTLRTEGEE